MLSRSSSSSIVRAEHRSVCNQVGVNGIRQPLWSLLVGREPAVSSLFDHLALAACADAQVRRAEALAVATAVDREVRPVLATALPEAIHPTPELRIIIKRGIRLRVNCARANELVHVRRQVAWNDRDGGSAVLATMSPGREALRPRARAAPRLALRRAAGRRVATTAPLEPSLSRIMTRLLSSSSCRPVASRRPRRAAPTRRQSTEA